MNPALTGIYLGKCLAEGDALGALPFLTDIVNAVKQAAPNILRTVENTELTKLQAKLTGPSPTSTTPAGAISTTPKPIQAARPAWILPATIGGGILLAFLFLRRRGRGR